MAKAARRFVRGAAPFTLLTVLLAGCGGASDAEKSSGKEATGGKATVGGAGSPCALPVSFELVKDWEADATDAATAAPNPQGTVSLVCEIGGNAAGTAGLLRVWEGGTEKDPQRALKAFIDGFVLRQQSADYTEVRAGGFKGAAEVVYTEKDSAGKAVAAKYRAFAVGTGKGVVIVHLWGSADAEAGLLTAYELAKKTVRPSE
ncbi:lipoprotein [Streptomyces uncialis]|uniref:lipoprotein n=1 Tax=Streptomyces uncialis TaxID=1048205 RepID=UPI0033C00F13